MSNGRLQADLRHRAGVRWGGSCFQRFDRPAGGQPASVTRSRGVTSSKHPEQASPDLVRHVLTTSVNTLLNATAGGLTEPDTGIGQGPRQETVGRPHLFGQGLHLCRRQDRRLDVWQAGERDPHARI